ncbi:MAG: RNA 2',3'-cyclic phosphodiesterase [Clostridiales bacterium]|nr:RNA 2',3'-cyclic phosphodiesterase [Clostridiales bacterium]
MRLFIAINLNEEMKESLMDIQDTLRTYGIRGKETVPDNMHLTLAFVGEYDDPEQVKSVVDSIEIRPFEIKLRGIGTFRDLWWIGIENSTPLMAISRRLRRGLAEADIPFDRKKFSPHITIIRRANGRLSEVPEEEISSSFGAGMTVDHISLMRSDRGKQGMIYTEL